VGGGCNSDPMRMLQGAAGGVPRALDTAPPISSDPPALPVKRLALRVGLPGAAVQGAGALAAWVGAAVLALCECCRARRDARPMASPPPPLQFLATRQLHTL
jgi:hypothetical protein